MHNKKKLYRVWCNIIGEWIVLVFEQSVLNHLALLVMMNIKFFTYATKYRNDCLFYRSFILFYFFVNKIVYYVL